MALKQSGKLQYAAVGVPGAGGIFGPINVFLMNDNNGNRYGGGNIPANSYVSARFEQNAPFATPASNPGRARIPGAVTVAGGFITGLQVSLINDSPAGPDLLDGNIEIEITHSITG